MRYTNPYTRALSWQKTWFFFGDDVQYVMVSNLRSTTSAPVYSVLDQRRHNGDIFVDGQAVTQNNFTAFNTLWHGGVGYSIDRSLGYSDLSVEVGDKTGNWSTIGTSKQPPVTVDLFAAYLTHGTLEIPTSYSIFPATSSLDEFLQKKKRTQLKTIQNDDHISAVYDEKHHTLMIVFWDLAGGSTVIGSAELFDASLSITSNGNSAMIYQLDTGKVTVSDPTQTLINLEIRMTAGPLGKKPPHWGWKIAQRLSFELPTSGMAGSSVTKTISE